MPDTTARTFGYTDDWANVTNDKDVGVTEEIDTDDWSVHPQIKASINTVENKVYTIYFINKIANT